jgi:hypothetical protein
LYDGTIKNLGVVVDMDIGESSAVAVAGLVIVNVGTISNCYVAGNIKVSSPQGNFIGGGIVAVNNGIIENSYSKADITANSSVGGLVGENYGIVESSFALRHTVEDRFSVHNYGAICQNSALKSAEEMKRESTFFGWDFVNIWAIAPNVNDGFPYLRVLR